MKILLAMDGSEGALDAARFLSGLDHRRDTQVHLLTIQAETDGASGLAERTEKIFAAARATLGDFPGHITAAHTGTHCSTSGIVDRLQVAAEMLPADLVVTGSRGNGRIARFFLGSVALGVARHAPCSVLIGRAPEGPLRRIVVGIDDTGNDFAVVRFLRRLPLPKGCAIHLVSVVMATSVATHSGAMLPAALRQEIAAIVRQAQVRARQRLDATAAELHSCGWSVTTELRYGDPTTELLEPAADLVVIGARGTSTAEHYLLGSVPARIIQQAHCSVLVVRP